MLLNKNRQQFQIKYKKTNDKTNNITRRQSLFDRGKSWVFCCLFFFF